jgi:putative hydrolase of the HAD superfamily
VSGASTARFDAVLLDAGGILVMPDPVAIGSALEPFAGSLPIHRFHRAHHAGLRRLEHDAVLRGPLAVEHLDWDDYRHGYIDSLGAPADEVEEAIAAMKRVWSPLVWRFRIEESVAALWRLHHLRVPIGIVSNASGQIEGVLRNEGVCQVGEGPGVPVTCIVDSHVVGIAKPDPAIFAPALSALASLHGGLDPARIAYVGDSAINDVGGARAAGLVPLHLDPYGDYAGFEHERIASLHDVVDWV